MADAVKGAWPSAQSLPRDEAVCPSVASRPKPIKALVSTSYVEKHNQTMRQHMRRFTRLTNGHSKKIENHVHMVALYTTWHNFAQINSAVRMSPAMAAGIEERLLDIGDIVNLIKASETAKVARCSDW